MTSMLVLGLEGSANKIGVGIFDGEEILANVRKTFVPSVGCGFLPNETAKHHRDVIIELIGEALAVASKKIAEIDLVCFTKGNF